MTTRRQQSRLSGSLTRSPRPRRAAARVGVTEMVVKQPKPLVAGLELGAVLCRLHSNDIRVGLSTFGSGVYVWISDQAYIVRADHELLQSGADATSIFDSAALWVHEAALRLFPGSPYARQFRVGIVNVNAKAAKGGSGKCSDSKAEALSWDKNGPKAPTRA